MPTGAPISAEDAFHLGAQALIGDRQFPRPVLDGDFQVVDAPRLASRSVNSPWDGWKLEGRVRHTIYQGAPTVRDGVLA